MFTIYTKPDCNFCVKAKDLLNLRGEPFMEIDVSKDNRAKEKIKNLGFKTVPQIFYPDGKHFGDYLKLENNYV